MLCSNFLGQICFLSFVLCVIFICQKLCFKWYILNVCCKMLGVIGAYIGDQIDRHV